MSFGSCRRGGREVVMWCDSGTPAASIRPGVGELCVAARAPKPFNLSGGLVPDQGYGTGILVDWDGEVIRGVGRWGVVNVTGQE